MELVQSTKSLIAQSPKAAIVTTVSVAVAATSLALLIAQVGSSGSTAPVVSKPTVSKVAPLPPVLAKLSPQSRRYVQEITRLTPAQQAAAFGNGPLALLRLTPKERQYVWGISALTPEQIAAAFGTKGRAQR